MDQGGVSEAGDRWHHATSEDSGTTGVFTLTLGVDKSTTLPPGTDGNASDLDYTGTARPPPGSGVPALSEDETMNFARWIDLGCPINVGQLSSPAATPVPETGKAPAAVPASPSPAATK